MKIAIWGFGKPVLDTIMILNNTDIVVSYVKVDYRHIDVAQFITVIKQLGIKNVFIEDVPVIDVDIIFLINYNRILPEYIIKNRIVVNYHVGLLPMWRGNSANGWGIINGCEHVGYTIHKVIGMLDAGPIYYQFKYPYIEGQTYYDARIAMYNDYSIKIPSILYDIFNEKIITKSQNNQHFVYCTKFLPIDGIVDWNESTDTILRRFYVFAPPLGTGLKFSFKGNEYYILKISSIPGFASSKGVPGSIVYKDNHSIWIKTGDTAISVEKIMSDGLELDIPKTFIIGQRIFN